MKVNPLAYAFASTIAVFLSGCAWYNIKPINASEADWKSASPKNGYIFYQPELYFMVTIPADANSNGSAGGATKPKQTVTVAPVYLPNIQKPYRLTTHNILGKADFEFQFENGWKLTSLCDKSDNSTVAAALASALQTAVSSGSKAAAPGGGGSGDEQVILFKPQYAKDGTISSFTKVAVIQ
jgi:hypothetical protein